MQDNLFLRCVDSRKLHLIISYKNQTTGKFVYIKFQNENLTDRVYYDEIQKKYKIGIVKHFY